MSVKRPERVREVLGITFDPVDNLVSGFSGPESDSSNSAQHMAEPKGDAEASGISGPRRQNRHSVLTQRREIQLRPRDAGQPGHLTGLSGLEWTHGAS